MEGKTAFVSYIMAGDPDYDTSLEIVKALPKAGVDIIELGLPFTDPMADGPTIQLAGQRALDVGMTLNKTLQLAADFRKTDNTTPIVLMGYYNPNYSHGVEKFLADAKARGLDGLGVVDLAPGEDKQTWTPGAGRGAGVGWPRPRVWCRTNGLDTQMGGSGWPARFGPRPGRPC